jgi:hypothetical protein
LKIFGQIRRYIPDLDELSKRMAANDKENLDLVSGFDNDTQLINLFSLNDFKNEFKGFGNFGILYGLAMTQIILAPISNDDELIEDLTNNEAAKDVFVINDADSANKHDKRINGLLTDYIDVGYFTPLSKT